MQRVGMALMPLVSVDHMMQLVNRFGVADIISCIADAIDEDLRR